MLTDWTLESLLHGYQSGSLTPRDVVREMWQRAEDEDAAIWIHRLSWEELESHLGLLEGKTVDDLPLYGIPFAIKDNIDLAGTPTTAACPGYAYPADESAFVVRQLIEAGAIPMGKTNLDQFATGLVGVRSPYGVPGNAFNPDLIPGGSSSGSAVAVAKGMAAFSLGTDTAGSGRVPASFNNLVGWKPSRGILSCSGVVPACRSLDCVSVFALSVADARRISEVVARFDPADGYARPAHPVRSQRPRRKAIGVPQPDQLEFFGNDGAIALFEQSRATLAELGFEVIEVDCQPLLDAARLLYEGPWVAERYAAIKTFIEDKPEALHPVTRGIIGAATDATAVAAFESQYRLADLRRQADTLWEAIECLMLPTAGTVYTIAEVEADPVQLNSNLGRFTNFMNLLDLCAWAVPSGFLPNQQPWGITFCSPAFEDSRLARIAARFHAARSLPLGKSLAQSSAVSLPQVPQQGMEIAVFGAHLEGLPLNGQLTDRGGHLLSTCRTAPDYRMFRLPASGAMPDRPGLVQVAEGGVAIDGEIWTLPSETVGSFLAGIAAPLGLGRVTLDDGREVCGFICEGHAVEGLEDLSAFGSWKAWRASLNQD